MYFILTLLFYKIILRERQREKIELCHPSSSKIVSQPNIPLARNPAPNPIAPAVNAVCARLLLLLLFPPKWPWCRPLPPRPWCLPWCRRGLLRTLSTFVSEVPKRGEESGLNHCSLLPVVNRSGVVGAPRTDTKQQNTWDGIKFLPMQNYIQDCDGLDYGLGLASSIPEEAHRVSWSRRWKIEDAALQLVEGWLTLSQNDLHPAAAEEVRVNIRPTSAQIIINKDI